MDVDNLAELITSRLPAYATIRDHARSIADELLTIGAMVPIDDWLIVGGSLARGEPTMIPGRGGLRLISDIDCLYVHYGDSPSMPVQDLISLASKTFPTVDIETMSLHDYRALETAIGYDFKNLGLALTDRGLPPHDPVTLDLPRDAYEILLYYVMAWMWHGCFDQWLSEEQAPEFHLIVNRLCIKVLRATGMLDGAYHCHDIAKMDPIVGERMRTELDWRADPSQPPLTPGRFWTYVSDAFDAFDYTYGHPHTDAVTWTRYSHTSEGRIVAKYQRMICEIARHLAYAWQVQPSPSWQVTVLDQVWTRMSGWTGTFHPGGPERFFADNKQDIHDHLLAMKVQTV